MSDFSVAGHPNLLSEPVLLNRRLPIFFGKSSIYGSIHFEAIMRTTNEISALNLTDLNSNGLFDIIVTNTLGAQVYIDEDHL